MLQDESEFIAESQLTMTWTHFVLSVILLSSAARDAAASSPAAVPGVTTAASEALCEYMN